MPEAPHCVRHQRYLRPTCVDCDAEAKELDDIRTQLAEAQRERDRNARWLSTAVAALEWYEAHTNYDPGCSVAGKALAEIRGERHDIAPAVGADHCGGERCHTATRFCECTCVRCGGGISTATDEK
jgi:hypothetical protein